MGLYRSAKKLLSRATFSQGLKYGLNYILYLLRKIAVIPRSTRRDKFEDLSRMGLSYHELQKTKRTFVRLVWIYAIVMIIALSYAYLAYHKGLKLPAFTAVSLSVLAAAQAFKYHFWVFQITVRKLGCSISDWFLFLIGKYPH